VAMDSKRSQHSTGNACYDVSLESLIAQRKTTYANCKSKYSLSWTEFVCMAGGWYCTARQHSSLACREIDKILYRGRLVSDPINRTAVQLTCK